ncbi:MAG: hypothetical protein ABH956_02400 [Candidatus Nealsonbacteria bacterium]
MKQKVKNLLFPGTAIVASSYFSLIFVIGGIIGYIGTEKFIKKYIRTGKVNIIEFNFGKYKIHLHHWITGIGIVLAIYFVGILSSLPIIFVGALGGLIFHDLHTDKEWHKVIYKEKTKEIII